MSYPNQQVYVEGLVGATLGADGTTQTRERRSKTNASVTTEAHARYLEAVSRGSVFIGANQTGTSVTTQAGLSATTPALTLYNPFNSGYNLSLLNVTVNITAAPAAATAICLASSNGVVAAAPGTNTLATVVNAMIGKPATPVGQCYRVTTLNAAPVSIRHLGFVSAASLVAAASYFDDTQGSVIISPGTLVTVQALTAVAVLCSFCWEEIPIV